MQNNSLSYKQRGQKELSTQDLWSEPRSANDSHFIKIVNSEYLSVPPLFKTEVLIMVPE